jgi:hypothetical protein
LKTRKEIQVLMIERDRLTDALRKLDENREAGKVTKLDYDILRERYENKLREVEAELGLGEKARKPGKLARLKLWRRKRGKRT